MHHVYVIFNHDAPLFVCHGKAHAEQVLTAEETKLHRMLKDEQLKMHFLHYQLVPTAGRAGWSEKMPFAYVIFDDDIPLVVCHNDEEYAKQVLIAEQIKLQKPNMHHLHYRQVPVAPRHHGH